MKEMAFSFPSGTVRFLETDLPLFGLFNPSETVLLTDENVFRKQRPFFEDFRTLVVPAGEASKSLEQVEALTTRLLEQGADRHTHLVGIGGGVITDLCGFLSAVFMRGIRCSLVPTTLLAMADAAWGGKNGVNLHKTKNILGTIRQPRTILHQYRLLRTLPQEEWSNGFAEIIKYGCIADPGLFEQLGKSTLTDFTKHLDAIQPIVAQCVALKHRIVAGDEQENGARKTLNFGHTVGHALEAATGVAHGQAVGVGMRVALAISVAHCGLPTHIPKLLDDLLRRYGLPLCIPFDSGEVLHHLTADKKRRGDAIEFILLQNLGETFLRPLSVTEIAAFLDRFSHAGNC